MKISRVGIDLAKNVFQVHGVDEHGELVWKRSLKRATWLGVFFKTVEPGCEVAMEACTGESPRVFRRLVSLSQAAMADSSRWR